jgi:sec-independent protein translocase protein TatB
VFNLSGSEIMFLLLAGLVVLGPERLPGVIRQAGKLYGQVRRATNGFEQEFRETFKEPIKDFTSAADDIKHGFGLVDTEPSPPMRPERSAIPKPNFETATDSKSQESPAESLPPTEDADS